MSIDAGSIIGIFNEANIDVSTREADQVLKPEKAVLRCGDRRRVSVIGYNSDATIALLGGLTGAVALRNYGSVKEVITGDDYEVAADILQRQGITPTIHIGTNGGMDCAHERHLREHGIRGVPSLGITTDDIAKIVERRGGLVEVFTDDPERNDNAFVFSTTDGLARIGDENDPAKPRSYRIDAGTVANLGFRRGMPSSIGNIIAEHSAQVLGGHGLKGVIAVPRTGATGGATIIR
jgi:hypothetical protein